MAASSGSAALDQSTWLTCHLGCRFIFFPERTIGLKGSRSGKELGTANDLDLGVLTAIVSMGGDFGAEPGLSKEADVEISIAGLTSRRQGNEEYLIGVESVYLEMGDRVEIEVVSVGQPNPPGLTRPTSET